MVDIELIALKIKKLVSSIQKLIPQNSDLLCCLLGDFSDQGDACAYDHASAVLSYLQNELSHVCHDINIEYEIVPGNHDLCENVFSSSKKDLTEFNKFASNFLKRDISFSDQSSIVESEHFGYHFLAASTVTSGETSYGCIDYSLLGRCATQPGSILLAHHGVVSSDSSDVSAIRDGYRLHQFLEVNHCTAFLHGHTHGFKRYTEGDDCQIIGAGPFLKNESKYDISNQCNLINVSGGFVKDIKTLTYQGDREGWDVSLVYAKNEDNNYIDTDPYSLYCRVLKNADENKWISNLRMQIRTSFSSYEKSITDNFASIKDDAIAWQSTTGDEHLELTHGQQMDGRDVSWLDFLVKTLKENPTTKRAIIPLIDKEKVFHSSDDQYLVSFDLIQVGFSSNSCNTLYITVYLRALEVRYFLPINMYEVYLITKKLKDHFPTIEELSICLFSYRAEAKKNYGCLKKADIDILSESQICQLIFEKKYQNISALLEQKKLTGDTVIDMRWLTKVKNAFLYCYQGENKEEILMEIEFVNTKLAELKNKRRHCSNYSLTQTEENAYCDALSQLIELLGR